MPEGRIEDAMRIAIEKTDNLERKEGAPEVCIATVADAADIARIHQESAVLTYMNDRIGITREEMVKYLGSREEARTRWENYLQTQDPEAHITVLKISDRVVGFCRVRRDTDAGKVEMLYLDPAHAGKGMGGEIFQESLQWLGEEQPIELDVASYNSRAIRFYERFGFRKQGFAKPLVTTGGKRIPLVTMVRDRQEE